MDWLYRRNRYTAGANDLDGNGYWMGTKQIPNGVQGQVHVVLGGVTYQAHSSPLGSHDAAKDWCEKVFKQLRSVSEAML